MVFGAITCNENTFERALEIALMELAASQAEILPMATALSSYVLQGT